MLSMSWIHAMAETVIGLYKTEVIRRRGPWRNIDAVEYATLEWVDWFNRRRLLGPLGYVPPSEFEEAYHRSQEQPARAAGLQQSGLRRTRGGSDRLFRLSLRPALGAPVGGRGRGWDVYGHGGYL